MIKSLVEKCVASLMGVILTCSVEACRHPGTRNEFDEWSVAGANTSGNKFSSLKQIDTANVTGLHVAWTYHTGDADVKAFSQIQCNPIIVNGVMYGTTPQLALFAIDAATGTQKWLYKPALEIKGNKLGHFNLNNNRGVTYWTDGGDDERIFYATGPYLQAIDARTGKLILGFGTGGRIDLHDGLGETAADLFITATSPPSLYKDLVLTGTRVSEAMDAAPGDIRAYDVHTGKQRWIFHTIPHPGEAGYESWEDPNAWKMTGGANSWMGMTIDHKTGIAYIPLGSASTDFYGGKRRGSNLFADCLLALDATTGKRLWHFQYIHHDTWDWDPSSAPVLISVRHDGRMVDAVAQTTKTGFVYLFDRKTGKPLFDVKETPVDTFSELKNEKLWPTQPVPQRPLAFVRQSVTENDINPFLSAESRADILAQLRSYHKGKLFIPQSKEGTVIFPGFDGGGEWGGPAVDPTTGVLYVNANEMAWILKMYDVQQKATGGETYGQAGVRLFNQNCMSCHGAERKGGGNYPSLIGIEKKLNKASFVSFINAGRGMMPAFKHLPENEKEAIASYVLTLGKDETSKKFEHVDSPVEAFRSLPYNISGYNKFLSKEGYPAISPPWGSLSAIDLNTGSFLWKHTLGEDERFKGKETGCENYGGPAITAGGLLFIAATKDGKFRAFNRRTGKLLWETRLPSPGFATPSTYEINGRQFVVVACGGGKLGTQSGDSYVAFALNN